MLKLCLIVSLALGGLAGCTSASSDVRAREGRAYMQPEVGSPGRQTDFFGNSFRP